jgi:hypothetical protein
MRDASVRSSQVGAVPRCDLKKWNRGAWSRAGAGGARHRYQSCTYLVGYDDRDVVVFSEEFQSLEQREESTRQREESTTKSVINQQKHPNPSEPSLFAAPNRTSQRPAYKTSTK